MALQFIYNYFKTEQKVLFVFLLFFCQHMLSQSVKEVSITDGYPIEKVYVHINKPFFTTGEDIWFKIYLVDGKTHRLSTLSEIVYVELIEPNGKIVQKKTFKLTDGTAPGDFNLQMQGGKGIYVIRAYTNYMRNFDDSIFFEKKIFIDGAYHDTGELARSSHDENTSSRPDLQFFPEGGYMFNGFLNPIGFKATDNHGHGIPVAGKIIDAQDKVIKTFSSLHLGLGLFYFIPKKGNNYRAVIQYEDKLFTYALPVALNEGTLMTVVEKEKVYTISLQSTEGISINGFRISGKQKQQTVFMAEVTADTQKNFAVVKVPKDILMEGIIELTLVDSANSPIAERLLYHNAEKNDLKSSISTTHPDYGPKSMVTLDIKLDQYTKKEVTANLSLTVNNIKVLADKFYTTDIRTYFLLNSELRGTVEQPGYYFYSTDPQRKKNLDLLMRTQGWRQYLLTDDAKKSETYFQPEIGLSLKGKVVSSFDPEESLIGTIFLTSNNSEETVQDKVKTDSEGNFIFENLNFIDTTSLLINADVRYSDKKRKPTDNYNIVLDSLTSPEIPSKSSKSALLRPQVAQNISEMAGLNNRTIQLEEAFIEADKPEIEDKFERKRKGMPYKEATQTLDFEEFSQMGFPNLLQALQGRVPGLSIRNSKVFLRGSVSLIESSPTSQENDGSALVLLNGTPVDASVLNQTLPANVDFIDIIKGPRAAIYGSRAPNGVIVIYTKNGAEATAQNKEFGGSLNFTHPGYDYSKNFYEPKYPQKLTNDKPDNRTTLHWQPNVKLNDNGKAKVSFYTSAIPGEYRVELEGLTSEGTPIKTSTFFEVRNEQ